MHHGKLSFPSFSIIAMLGAAGQTSRSPGPQSSLVPNPYYITELDTLLGSNVTIFRDQSSIAAHCTSTDDHGRVRILFRADRRSPQEIRRLGGFYPAEWAMGMDVSNETASLIQHVSVMESGLHEVYGDLYGYVDTSCSVTVARHHAVKMARKASGKPVWLYQIVGTSESLNVQESVANLLGPRRVPGDLYANIGPIPWDRVIAHKEYMYYNQSINGTAAEPSQSNIIYDEVKYNRSAATEGESFAALQLPSVPCFLGRPLPPPANGESYGGPMPPKTPEDAAALRYWELQRERRLTTDGCNAFNPNAFSWVKHVIQTRHPDHHFSEEHHVLIELGIDAFPKQPLREGGVGKCVSAHKLTRFATHTETHGEVVAAPCSATSRQQMWTFNPRTRRIQARDSGLCLAVDKPRIQDASELAITEVMFHVRAVGVPCFSEHVGEEARWKLEENGQLTPDLRLTWARQERTIHLRPAKGDKTNTTLRVSPVEDFTTWPLLPRPLSDGQIYRWHFKTPTPNYW